jgi:hypothetical protein
MVARISLADKPNGLRQPNRTANHKSDQDPSRITSMYAQTLTRLLQPAVGRNERRVRSVKAWTYPFRLAVSSRIDAAPEVIRQHQ